MSLGLFIVGGLALSITAGAWFGILFTCEMKAGWKQNVVFVIIALVIGFGITTIATLEINSKHEKNEKKWNNGYCDNCGTEWYLINVDNTCDGNKYFYGCDNCGKVIETDTNFYKNIDN